MKHLFLFSTIIILLNSCARETECCEDIPTETNTSIETETPMITTAEEVAPLREFPNGFELDSMIRSETDEVLFTQTIYFLKSKSSPKFNDAMKKFVDKLVLSERPTQKNRSLSEQTSFDLWITKMEIKSDVVTCLFRSQSFTEGAAHYNQSDETFEFIFR